MKLHSSVKHALGFSPLALRVAQALIKPKGIHGHCTDYQKFVIAGYERGGSTMLTSALTRHTQAHCFSEVFNHAEPMFATAGYRNHSPWLQALRQHRPQAFLDAFVFRGYAPQIRAVGFKIFPEHAQDPRFAAVFERLVSDPSVKFIHLTRQNKLAVYLSMVRARATGVWAVTGKDAEQTQQAARLEPEECEQAFETLIAKEVLFRETLAGRDHIDVTYEQLAGNDASHYGRIQSYLGLDWEDMRPRTKKQRTLPLEKAISNFAELREYFSGSSWAFLFDPETPSF